MDTTETLTPREAAIRLGCGMKWIYDLLYAGKLPATKVENRWVIPAKAIEKRLRARTPDNPKRRRYY